MTLLGEKEVACVSERQGCKLPEDLGCHCFALLVLLVLQLQAKNVLAFFSKEVIL